MKRRRLGKRQGMKCTVDPQMNEVRSITELKNMSEIQAPAHFP